MSFPPEDVKRVNNLSISNLPDQWQPPTAPITGEGWKPPTEPIGAQPKQKSNFLDTLTKPILSVISPEMRAQGAELAHPGLNDSVWGARAKGFMSGATEAIGDLISSQSSPLNLGLEAASSGASLAKGTGLESIAKALQVPGKVATAGMVGHGLYNMIEEPTFAGKAGGFSETAMGGAGAAHLFGPKPPEIMPPTREPLRLKAGQYEMPPSSMEGIINEQGKVIAPPQPELPIRPDGPWKANIDLSKHGLVNPEERVYNLARDKFNMGKDLPTDVKAKFRFYQPDAEGGQFPMYDVIGGPHDKSTVSAEKLKSLGIKIPETPAFDKRNLPKHEEVQFATSGKQGIKIGADVRSLGKVLGSSLYQGDIAKIAAKELLQNSLDAVRHLGEHGKVDVILHHPYGAESYVEVKDNGKGLSLKEIQTVFSDLGSSGKREDTSAIGGFGLAKAAPLLGGEKVEVTSVVREKGKLLEHKFSGTPDDLLNGVQVETKELKEGTTGTTVRTYVPKDTSFWEAGTLVQKIAENSPGTKAQITVNDRRYGEGEITKHEPIDLTGANTTTLESPGASVDIIIPKDAKYAPRNGVRYSVTNNGMFQTMGQSGYGEVPGVPDKVIVNIRSKVPEGDRDYPFTANRENLRGTALEEVDRYIQDTIINPAVGKRVEQLRKVYEGLPKIELNKDNGTFHRDFFLYDTGQKFTPEELKILIENPHVKRLATDISDVLHEAMLSTNNVAWNEKLEKIGFIFDEGLKGIHIPNPGQEKSAILINPFSIMANNPPDKAAAGILHVILHEMAHVEGGGHDERFAGRLSDIYEAYGAANSVKAQDQIHGTISNGTEYHKSFQEILQQYTEARGRKGSEIDDLRGTGIGSENKKSGGKREVPKNAQPSPSRVDDAVTKLEKGLRAALPIRASQENMYSMERAKRIAKAEKIVNPTSTGEMKNPGLAGFRKQQSVLKGELPKEDYAGAGISETDVDTLIDGITNSHRLLPYEKIRAKIGLLKLASGEGGVPQNNELRLLNEAYGKVFDPIIEMHGGFGGPVALRALKDVINSSKAIMASIDLSAPMRQGLPLIHKKEWWGAMKPMVESLVSQKNFDALQTSIEERPGYLLGKEAGLKLTEIGKDPTKREEAYGSNLANLVPGVKASERAYVGFLNKLRSDTFDSLIENAKDAGLHPKDVMHDIANFVNVSTGRGSLGPLDKVATELNTVFFSPRLIASRLTMLNPNYYIKASPFVRKEALKSLLAVAGAGLTINGLMAAMGAETVYDPTNADFMKSRFGHTRVDPYGGFQQYIVAASRLISGKTTSSVTGKTQLLGKSFNAPTRKDIAARFLENKLSPVASFIDVLATGKDFEGKPIDVQQEVINRYKPMVMNDLIDLYRDDPNHLPLGIASALGMGMQTYGPTANQSNPMRLRLR